MKQVLRACILLPAVLFLSCTACSLPFGGESPPSEVTIFSWNVQNLFDDVSDGGEYDEFDPAKGEWNRALFHIRLRRIKEVLDKALDHYPDIILLQEIENSNTLEILGRDILKNRYPWRVILDGDGASVCTAVLSTIPVSSVTKVETGYLGRLRLRPITEVHFDLEGRELVVFNDHWKSRSGGAAATEAGRITAAEALTARIKDLLASDPDRLILAAGDFNENHDEYKRIGRKYRTALIPAIESVPDDWNDSLYVCSTGSKCSLGGGRLTLFSPWYGAHSAGTYAYKSQWDKIDHFFLWKSFFDGKGYEFGSFQVVKKDFLLDDYGHPNRWISETEEGYSDHLPILLRIVDNGI